MRTVANGPPTGTPLPRDLWLCVFSFLKRIDLKAAAEVCGSFRTWLLDGPCHVPRIRLAQAIQYGTVRTVRLEFPPLPLRHGVTYHAANSDAQLGALVPIATVRQRVIHAAALAGPAAVVAAARYRCVERSGELTQTVGWHVGDHLVVGDFPVLLHAALPPAGSSPCLLQPDADFGPRTLFYPLQDGRMRSGAYFFDPSGSPAIQFPSRRHIPAPDLADRQSVSELLDVSPQYAAYFVHPEAEDGPGLLVILDRTADPDSEICAFFDRALPSAALWDSSVAYLRQPDPKGPWFVHLADLRAGTDKCIECPFVPDPQSACVPKLLFHQGTVSLFVTVSECPSAEAEGVSVTLRTFILADDHTLRPGLVVPVVQEWFVVEHELILVQDGAIVLLDLATGSRIASRGLPEDVLDVLQSGIISDCAETEGRLTFLSRECVPLDASLHAICLEHVR